MKNRKVNKLLQGVRYLKLEKIEIERCRLLAVDFNTAARFDRHLSIID